jgi:hypothetical protein
LLELETADDNDEAIAFANYLPKIDALFKTVQVAARFKRAVAN